MEELDIREILSYFWEKIFYFFVIVLMVLVIGCVYSIFIQKPMYTSKTSIVLTGFSTVTNGESTITQTDLNINSKLVSTYQEIVKSRRVLNQVIDELHLVDSVESLAKKISVYSVSDTEIIEIAVTSEKANEAYLVANAVSEIFSKEVKDLYNLSNVSVLDNAEMSTMPSNLNLVKEILIYLVVGIVLACAVLFLTFYFDTTIKGAQDIEKRYNLPILGTVPDYNKKKKRGKKHEK